MNSFLRLEERHGFPEGQGLVVERIFGRDEETTMHDQEEIQQWIGVELIRSMQDRGLGEIIANPAGDTFTGEGSIDEQAAPYAGLVLATVERFRAAVAAGEDVRQALYTSGAETLDFTMYYRPLRYYDVELDAPEGVRTVRVLSCNGEGAGLAAVNAAVRQAKEWNAHGLSSLPGMGGHRVEDPDEYWFESVTFIK